MEDEAEKRKRRITRALYGSYILITALFVISNVRQVGTTLFGAPPPGPLADGPCATGISELAAALDRGARAAVGARDDGDAEQRYLAGRLPEWDRAEAVKAACTTESRGTEAFAALARLERAQRSAVGKRAAAVAPVRREVDSFIR